MSERVYPKELDPLDSGRRGHKARYYMAKGYIQPGDTVLDVACGAGYGTEILAQVSGAATTGLDVSEAVIQYAKENHSGTGANFSVADLDEWVPEPGQADVVVSFETVEHLKGEPAVFIEKLKAASKRVILFSAPIVPSKHINHHHLHDLTEQQILDAFQSGGEWVCYEAFHHRVYGVYIFTLNDKAHLL
jgi:2-polyprenyl-3-methyl-5-hydroxy-6-metoxy-1,4-benzoquinol methylase